MIAVTLSEFARHDPRPLKMLQASGHEVRINRLGRRLEPAELVDFARDADAVIAGLERYDVGTLQALPRLRCITRCGVGLDNVDVDAARARGVAVLNTPGAPVDAVAELAVTMTLALLHSVVPQHQSMRARRWERLPTRLLHDRSVVILGLGRVGRRTAELLRPFRARLSAVDPALDREWCAANGVTPLPLADALPLAEILVVTAARDPVSPLRLDAGDLACLPRGAIVVNVARGGLVDEGALAEALRDGHLRGAGLDVYEEEPYRGPLCDVEGTLLSPHAATFAVETRVAMEVESVERVLAWITDAWRAGPS